MTIVNTLVEVVVVVVVVVVLLEITGSMTIASGAIAWVSSRVFPDGYIDFFTVDWMPCIGSLFILQNFCFSKRHCHQKVVRFRFKFKQERVQV